MTSFGGKLMNKAKGAAVLISFVLCACATSAATENMPTDGAPARDMSPLGAYLAGRHAQQQHQYSAAAPFALFINLPPKLVILRVLTCSGNWDLSLIHI